MKLVTEKYVAQKTHWPQTGRHILAQFDHDTVVVYQAYCVAIGRFAAENQRFGGPFKFDRMSWIKPNFLWMMYRSGWASKRDQEVVLAVWLRREGFEHIVKIEDISELVREQCRYSYDATLDNLTMPRERTYPVNAEIAKRLGMTDAG